MGAGGLGGGEVVMLQASTSYFAYEPILSALQTAAPIPLAHALLPAPEGAGGGGGAGRTQAPAFACEPGVRYNLSCLLDPQRKELLSAAQLDRWARIGGCGREGDGKCGQAVSRWGRNFHSTDLH